MIQPCIICAMIKYSIGSAGIPVERVGTAASDSRALALPVGCNMRLLPALSCPRTPPPSTFRIRNLLGSDSSLSSDRRVPRGNRDGLIKVHSRQAILGRSTTLGGTRCSSQLLDA